MRLIICLLLVSAVFAEDDYGYPDYRTDYYKRLEERKAEERRFNELYEQKKREEQWEADLYSRPKFREYDSEKERDEWLYKKYTD